MQKAIYVDLNYMYWSGSELKFSVSFIYLYIYLFIFNVTHRI